MTQLFELIGPTTRKKQDGFDDNDEEIKEMLAGKNRLHRIYQLDQSSAAKKTAFTNIRTTVQTRLRNIQDSWLAAKADEIPKFADTHDSKRLYCALKQSTDRNHRAIHSDTLNKTLTSFNIDVTNWEVCAQDRPLCRSEIHT